MLVALHGFAENDLVWREALAPVVGALRCPLLPGHGWSPCPPTATIASVAADLARKHLAGEPGDLLGYSMGGRLALTLALDHPKAVRRLVLISSGPGFTDAKLQAKRRDHEEGLAGVLEEDGLGPFVAMWEANPILKPAKPLPRAAEEDLRARRLDHDPKGLAGALRQLGAGAMPELRPRLKQLRIPVLLIAGSADERYQEVMSEMAKLIPEARLEVVPEAGHAVHRERLDAVRRLVADFLR